jgi:23S rRNA pseudouridine2605 synthase
MSGITSRRGAEKLIEQGRVTINRNKVERPGALVDPDKDIVKVDEDIIRPIPRKYYILLNKPRDVITALSDPYRRKTVAYFTKKLQARVYPVGRLDYDTEGVLLLTNDGELAYRLAHPKFEIKRIYHALVKGTFTSDDARMIEEGIALSDGHVGRAQVRILTAGINASRTELTLAEGHKREIKQLLKAVNHPVLSLRRVEFAGLRVDFLKRGRWRHLNPGEIAHLRKLVGLK